MDKEEQRRMTTRIKLAAELINSQSIKPSANWVITNVLGGRNMLRKYKISKILNEGEGNT